MVPSNDKLISNLCYFVFHYFKTSEIKVCDVDPEIKELANKFRFRKAQTLAAIVRKCT